MPKFKKSIDQSGQRLLNVGDPSAATDAVNLQTLQAQVRNGDNKDAVRVATTGNISIAAPGATIDGVTMAAGDRMLVRAQTTGSENGIYVWNGAAVPATRSTDADANLEVTQGLSVAVIEGTTKGTGGTQTNPVQYALSNTGAVVVGTTALTFAVVGGAGLAYTADGNGIELVAQQFQLELDGTTLQKSAAGVRIGSGAAGAGLVETTGVLAVGAGTGITVNADDIQVNTSVVVRKYAADSAATTNPQTFTHGLGTNDVTVAVWETNEQVYPDVTKGSGTVIIDWGSAPTAAQYRVVIHG